MISKENVQEWIKLIEVDWLGQYAKTWIAFNAWYRKHLGSGRDRHIIQIIKSDEKEICSTIESFFMDTGTESKAFQSNVAELQSLLALTGIESEGRKISFEAITDYKHAQNINETVDGTTYEVEMDIENVQRHVKVKDASDEIIFNGTIPQKAESLDINENWFKSVFRNTPRSLSEPTQETLLVFLNESSPLHNILAGTKENCIKIENFQFINNENLIVRALIEILYQLRNSLFHGEITHTRQIQEVYEPAYLILKRIILIVLNTSSQYIGWHKRKLYQN